MSNALVAKVHVDALVTAALRWTAPAPEVDLPGALRQQLALWLEDTDRLGLALLQTNWNTVVYGGDPDELDDVERAMLDEEARDYEGLPPTSYALEELPGTPSAETVLRLVQSYRYQTYAEAEGLGEVGPFVDTLEQSARQLLGDLDAEAIKALPRYAETPWLPGDADRDLFVRLT